MIERRYILDAIKSLRNGEVFELKWETGTVIFAMKASDGWFVMETISAFQHIGYRPWSSDEKFFPYRDFDMMIGTDAEYIISHGMRAYDDAW
jgi:hypothetical protein